MPKSGGRRRKRRTHALGAPEGATVLSQTGGSNPVAQPLKEDVPRSIVAKASKVAPQVSELVRDLRKLMNPYTANNLREKSYNRMKDYTAVAGQLGVSHILALSQTKSNVILRIGRHADGPTLHFKVNKYSLSRQVKALQKRPFESPGAYTTPPLVVLNAFGQSDESQVKLMKIAFQNMFPTINTKTVRLSDCKRVVLFHYKKEDGTVEMRHYAIRAQPVGISRSIKKVLQSRIPDLSALEDVSEFVEGHGLGAQSDSEAEDEGSRVVLPEKYSGRGNAKAQQSAMKLSELGPRMTLEIFKVERGLCEGDILYHKFEEKSVAEAAALKAKVEKQKMLKAERKAIQEANVKRKRELAEEKRQAKADRKRRRIEEGGAARDGDEADDEDEDDDGAGDDGKGARVSDYGGDAESDDDEEDDDDDEDDEEEEEDDEVDEEEEEEEYDGEEELEDEY